MRRGHRRQAVLDAARVVFAERGYHAASVANIIEEARIARGTFYLYFESKRAVFSELVDQFLAALRNSVKGLKIGREENPPHEQLRANFSRVLALLGEEPEMAVILLDHAHGLDEESDRKLLEFYDQMAHGLERALEAGRALGLVSIEDTEIAARAVLGGLKEVVRFLTIHGGEPRDHERLVDDLLRVTLRGVLDGPMKQLLEPVLSPLPSLDVEDEETGAGDER